MQRVENGVGQKNRCSEPAVNLTAQWPTACPGAGIRRGQELLQSRPGQDRQRRSGQAMAALARAGSVRSSGMRAN
jgi:hypothetical protein